MKMISQEQEGFGVKDGLGERRERSGKKCHVIGFGGSGLDPPFHTYRVKVRAPLNRVIRFGGGFTFFV